jgi:hypothetical protein
MRENDNIRIVTRFLHLLLAAWLVLGLPLGHQQALLHALDHAIDDGTVQEDCPDHSLYTPFASALGSAVDCKSVAPEAPQAIASPIRADAPAAPRASYHSRAPPAFS